MKNETFQSSPIKVSEQELENIKEDYREIFLEESLSSEQEDRLQEILEIALVDEDVDFWVSHITTFESKKLSQTDPDSLKNEKATLEEYIGTDFFEGRTIDEISTGDYEAILTDMGLLGGKTKVSNTLIPA